MPRPADPDLRDRILTVAGRLFYAHGVRAVGMAQIVAAAGCGKNALYRHFPSKADLVAAYLTGFGEMRERAVHEALAGIDDPAEALVALTRDVAANAAHEQFHGCAIRNYLREIRRTDDEPGQVALDLLTRWRGRIGALAAHVDVADPDALAERIWLVHDGVYGDASPDPARAGETAIALVRELVSGGQDAGGA